MARIDFFDSPFVIGFDRLLDRIDQIAAQQSQVAQKGGYPPFNIVKESEDHFTLEMAVAGFTEDQVEVVYQDSTLTVAANTTASSTEDKYLHRGIANRSFSRKFNLADTIVVKGADMVNGMLKVHLENVIPEEKKPQRISINSTATYLAG